MSTLQQSARMAGFTLVEYWRSGRIFLELALTVICYFVFFRPTATPITAGYLFSVIGVILPGLAILTTSVMISLGDRPQGYVILAHNVSRGAYLLGLFLAAVMVVTAIYGVLCLIILITNRATDLDLGGWFLATLSLALNIGLVSAITLLLSPLVLSSGWRLFTLALVALALSSNVIGGPIRSQIENFNPMLFDLLRAAQTVLSGPLVPAFYGYQLSVTRAFDTLSAWANLVAQSLLLLAVLGLAHYAFNRRDLIFSVS